MFHFASTLFFCPLVCQQIWMSKRSAVFSLVLLRKLVTCLANVLNIKPRIPSNYVEVCFLGMLNRGCIKMTGAVLKLIIFTRMVNRIINTSRNERVTQQIYDTYPQIFDVCTLCHMAHIEAIVQFLPYSAQQVRCDGLHSRGNSVLQIRYAHRLWWHKHFVLHLTPKEVVTRG